jgi:hypothetical protein
VRSRTASLALLCLMAHALFVSVTHHHKPAQSSQPARAIITDARHGDSSHTPDSNGDAHCLSCRLQRNFNSNVQATSLTVQFSDQPAVRDTLWCEPRLVGASLQFSGRAPPLA